MKNQDSEVMPEIQKTESVKTGDLDEAIKSIHERYGNDLQAFFRDAKNEILRRQNPVPDKSEARCDSSQIGL